MSPRLVAVMVRGRFIRILEGREADPELVGLLAKLAEMRRRHEHVQEELAEKHNVAVAILCAAVILGICYIVAQVVH